jgi:hypothetical protein
MMKSLMTLCAATLICSCQPALVNLPPTPDCPKPAAAQPPQCPALAMPAPIPQKFHIQRDGARYKTDQAGKEFLLNYVDLREKIDAHNRRYAR